MQARIPALAIAGLLVGAALPAMAELGPCKRDARETANKINDSFRLTFVQ
jgi:hypothetical protein